MPHPTWYPPIEIDAQNKLLRCSMCKEYKRADEFYPHKKKKRGYSTYCKNCTSWYSKHIRKQQLRDRKAYAKEYNKNNTKQNRARSKARYHIYHGKIKKKPCSVCSADKAEVHHEDYNKPLDITWLCRSCHMKQHNIKEQKRLPQCIKGMGG